MHLRKEHLEALDRCANALEHAHVELQRVARTVRHVRKVNQPNVRRESTHEPGVVAIRHDAALDFAVVEKQERAGDELELLLLCEPGLELREAREELYSSPSRVPEDTACVTNSSRVSDTGARVQRLFDVETAAVCTRITHTL